MTDKQKYWIHDHEGVYALVEGTEARNWWTLVKGWVEADEPGATELVHVLNENPEIAQGHPVPFGALGGWAGYGFYPAAPPDPEGTAPTPAPAAEAGPAKPTKAPAAAVAEQKEK